MTSNSIYKAMKHYRTKFTVITAVLAVIFVWYFAVAFPYISNVMTGASAFDESLYAENAQMREVGEEIELHRNDATNIPEFALKDSSYWQGAKYEFTVPIEKAQNLGIAYTNATTGTGSEENADMTSAVLYRAKVGGKDTLILAYPHEDLENMTEVTGIFTSIPLIVEYDVAKNENFSSDDEISVYMLDTRGLEMESEQFDLVFSISLFAIVVFLTIRLLRQYKNYRITPTYRQLEKYGSPDDVAVDVDCAIKGKKWVKGEIETERWIVKKDTFKLKIIRNYRTHGKFEYVKKNN